MRQLSGMVNVRGRNRTLTWSTPQIAAPGRRNKSQRCDAKHKGRESARFSSFALASQ
jgi:hypothetical protein